jgi:aminoglycoside phosphotransferase (APT) family kinase protein
LYPDYDLTRQVMVMNRLRGTPIAVPTVCWLDRDGNDVGTPYYVMEQLPTIGTASDYPSYHSQGLYFDATPAQRATMWWGCVGAIADVHALDWRALRLDKLLMPQRGSHPLEQVVAYCAEMLSWLSPEHRRQEFVEAVNWLRDNTYEPEHLVLCWGDSRLSNVLYGQDFEVTGVLDWEIAYIGDHEADLAWLLFVDWACSDYEGVPRLTGTCATTRCSLRSRSAFRSRDWRLGCGTRACSPASSTSRHSAPNGSVSCSASGSRFAMRNP